MREGNNLLKQGDLVVVKDGMGYNTLMQTLVGHVGPS